MYSNIQGTIILYNLNTKTNTNNNIYNDIQETIILYNLSTIIHTNDNNHNNNI